jgi:hypothetical protein
MITPGVISLYLFDSSKFERRFAFMPTPYADGIRECVRPAR